MQGGFNGAPVGGGLVGSEAHQQPLAAAAGGELKVLVPAVVGVIKVVAPGLAGFEHVTVEGKDAGGQRVGQVSEQGIARLLGQAHKALAGRVKVVESKILDLLATGPIHWPQQVDGREGHFQQRLKQLGRKEGGHDERRGDMGHGSSAKMQAERPSRVTQKQKK
jgi:hypothetical protein